MLIEIQPSVTYQNSVVEMKCCKTCGLILEATRDNFYSAGVIKGREYLKSNCIECEKEQRKVRYERLKEEAAIEQAQRLAQVRAKLTFNLYKKAREQHKVGQGTQAERHRRLKDYIEAEQTLRLIQNAMPPKRASVVIQPEAYKQLSMI